VRPLVINRANNRVYRVRHGLAKGFRRKGGTGFIPRPLSSEERFLKRQDFTGRTVYDVGGNEGVLSLFFSRAVGDDGKVITFEPHPQNCLKITENIRLNDVSNIILRPIGLGREKRRVQMVMEDSDLARGTMVAQIADRFLTKKGSRAIEVDIDRLDDQSQDLPPPDFVKIDVEGMEIDVLFGSEGVIEEYKPQLFIEIHGTGGGMKSKIENGRRIVEFLKEKGYVVYHVQEGKRVDVFNTIAPREDHLFCF